MSPETCTTEYSPGNFYVVESYGILMALLLTTTGAIQSDSFVVMNFFWFHMVACNFENSLFQMDLDFIQCVPDMIVDC